MESEPWNCRPGALTRRNWGCAAWGHAAFNGSRLKAGCPHPAHALKTVDALQTARSLLQKTPSLRGRFFA